MSIRFVIGRAGSGKSFHCLEAIRAELRRGAVDGPRLIFLVPEQASQQMERDLLVGGGIEASHRAEVLSFERLSRRVLESSGREGPRTLSDSARAMVLRHLLVRHADRLRYYRRPERWSGAAAKLSQTLAELIQEGIEPESLATAPPEAFRDAPARAAKLADLALLYAEYRRFLQSGFLDPSQCLAVARSSLDRCDWIRGANIWVDGFASMSEEETATLIALAKLAARMEITAMVDSDASNPLFAKPRRTLEDLERAFVTAGLSIASPSMLPAAPSPRFRTRPALAELERGWATLANVATKSSVSDGLELVELPSRRVEVEYAVSRIWQWACDDGAPYRYRDLAIIVRDIEPYHALLTAALESRGIPYFMDRRRPLTHHPLVELIRALVAVVAEDFSLESVRLLLKSGLFPLDDVAADELENYLLAHGIAGSKAWTGADWTFKRRNEITRARGEETAPETELLQRVNGSRRRVLDQLEPWVRGAATNPSQSGGAWAAAIREAIGRFRVDEHLARWTDDAERDGRPVEAEEHRQAWGEVFSFLDDLALAFADTPLTIDELAGVLDAGLSGLTAGLAPPTLDQLLVSAIERSRHPDIKAAVILGFNDGLFPARPVEDAILNDDDRARLRSAGFRLTPPAREAVLDEPLLAYIALTRPSEHLVVTYATTDDNGKALAPSPYVRTLLDAATGLTFRRESDPLRSRQTWDLLSSSDLRGRLAWEFRTRPPRDHDDVAVRGRWNELYDAIRGDISTQRAFSRAFEGSVESPSARLSAESVRRLWGDSLRTSVSRLETQAACPFRHFAQYTLGLVERQEAPIEPVDTGQVHHAILEDFVSQMSANGLHWSDLRDEGDVVGRLGASCDRVAAMLPAGGVLTDARNAAILRRSARSLATILGAQHRFWRQCAATPRGVELAFGFEQPGSLPALEIRTPKNRTVRLRGKIDRVDIIPTASEPLAVLLDYKRPKEKTLNLPRVHHGLSLQLLSYWLVLAEHGGQFGEQRVRPAAALYVPLGARITKIDGPSETEDSDAADTGKLRGILDDAFVDDIEPDAPQGTSPVLGVFRKKDGSLGNLARSDAIPQDAVGTLLSLVRTRIGELADAVLDGDAAVSPYRLGNESACTWCEMPAACRIDPGHTKPRILSHVDRSAVLGLTAAPDALDSAQA